MDKHKELVSKIFSVHEHLRSKRREHDGPEWDEIWKEHTENSSLLQDYARSMHDLAVKIWEPRNAVGTETDVLKCRLDWVHSKCREYFGIKLENSDSKLTLLDVGSCYNPFKKFSDLFDITAVDLCPAPGLENEVHQCDFLELGVSNKGAGSFELIKDHKGRLVALEQGRFDIVVFSFFLEYLPDKKQRLESCRKARELLKTGGVLFILRPDSGSVTPTGNSRLVKGLKVGCGLLGLRRIYFDKLAHLWCMGFVKLGSREKDEYLSSRKFIRDLEKVKEGFEVSDDSFEELFSISQDFREMIILEGQRGGSEGRVEVDIDLFDELPNFGSEDER